MHNFLTRRAARCAAGLLLAAVCWWPQRPWAAPPETASPQASPLIAPTAQAERAPRRLYVPVEDLDALLAHDVPGVMLSKAEYETLLAAAQQAAGEQAVKPDASVISRADYAAKIVGEQLQVTAEIEARNFRGGWKTAAIRIGNLGVESAAVDGEPARILRGEGEGQLLWLLPDAGAATLKLELSAPLQVHGSDRLFVLPLSGAPAGELQVSLPAGKHLQADGVLLKRPAEGNAEAEYRLPAGGRQSIELRITDRAADSRADVLTFASTAYGLQVAPGEVTWTARTSLQVVGRNIDQLVASVPQTLEVTGVESAGLESWELSDDRESPGRTAITLKWRQRFDGTQTITLRGIVRELNPADWQAPSLLLREVTSHTGVVEVRYPAGVRVQVHAQQGVRPTEQGSESAAGTEDAARLRFEVWREDFQLSFGTQVKERELHAALTNLLDIRPEGLDLYALVTVTPRFDALYELQVVLPAEWEVQDLNVAGVAAPWTTTPVAAGVNELRIPMSPALPPNQSQLVRVTARRLMENWPVEQTPVRIALPEVRLPQANIVEGLYGVTCEGDVDLAPVGITGLDPARKQDLETLERQLHEAGRQLRLGFVYQDTVFTGELEAVRKPTRLSAATLTFLQLERETIVTHLETQVRVEGGGLRELQVSLPEAAGSDLQFTLVTPYELQSRAAPSIYPPRPGVRIVEQTAAAPQNGRRVWMLKLDRRLYGDAVISTTVRQPRGEAQEFTPLVLDVVGAERQNGHVAVVADVDQRVQLTALDAAGEPLPLVDPVDFPASFTFPVGHLREGRRRIVASVQYLQPGYNITVTDERFERMPAPTAVCHAAEWATILSPSGERQHEARLRIVAVGVQGLSIRLPPGNRLWAALVDDQPVEVRQTGETIYLPLSNLGRVDTPRQVRLLYEGAAAPLGSFGHVRETPPEVTVITGAGTAQPLEILQQEWTLHHSRQTLVVDSDGRFHSPRPLDRDSLLGRLAGAWRFPTWSEWTLLLQIAGAGLLATLLIATAVRRFGLRATALGVTLAAVGLVVMTVCLLPTAHKAREAGRQFDLAESMSPATEQAAPPPTDMPAPIASDADEVQQFPTEPAPGAWERRRRNQPRGVDRLSGGGIGGGIIAEPQISSGQQLPFGAADGANPRPGVTTAPMSPSIPVEATPPRPDGEFNQGGSPPSNRIEPSMSPQAPALNIPTDRSAPSPPALGLQFGAQRNDPASQLPLSDSLESQWDYRLGEAAGLSVSGEEVFGRLKGGLLSLAIPFTPPASYESRTFTYLGSEGNEGAVDLDVTYADQGEGRLVAAAVAAGVLLLFWWLRRSSRGCRTALALVAILGPAALMSLAPAAWLFVLDGVLMGGLAGVALWAIRCCCECCRRCCRQGRGVCHPSPEVSGPVSSTGAVTAPAHLWWLLAGIWSVTAVTGVSADDAVPSAEAGRPIVIVPYAAGSDPLAAEQVFVPQELYLRLWRQAHPEEQPPATPPAPGVVASAAYAAALDATDTAHPTVRVQGRLMLRNLSTGAVVLPLPLGRVAIESAQLDGSPASVMVGEKGALQIALDKPGAQVLDLVFRVPATEVTSESGKCVIPFRPVAAGRLTFTLPGGEGVQVRLNGATDAYRIRQSDDGRVLEAAISSGGNVTLTWQPEASHGGVAATVQAESAIGATVDDAGLHVRQRFRFVVRQGTLKDVAFTVPAGAAIQRIEGAEVAGWESEEREAGRRLRIFFRRDVNDSTALNIDLFLPLELTEAMTSVDVPTLAPEGVTRESGEIALFAVPQLLVQAGGVEGLRQVNLAGFTMDAALSQPDATARFAYRFNARPFRLTANVSRRQPETRVVSQHGAQVQVRKTRLASRFEFDLREAPRGQLEFRLPADYLLLDVQGDYLIDWSVRNREGEKVLTVDLDRLRTGQVVVLLEGSVARDAAAASVTMALPQPLAIQRNDSQLGVWVEDTFTATIGSAGDWRAIDPADLTQSVQDLRVDGPQFAFRSQQAAPGDVSLQLTRAVPQFAADAVVLVATSDAAVDYGLTLRWTIEWAAADTFWVTTPAWLGAQLEFHGEGIRQVESTEQAGGTRLWRITLQQPVRGQYLLSAVSTRPLPTDELVRIPDVRFLTPGPVPDEAPELAVQRRFLVLVNLSRVHRLTPVDASLVTPAQREQLPLSLQPTLLDQALEIAALPPGRNLPEWRMEPTAGRQEAAATVLLADLQTVLAHDGTWRTQADYRVRNRGRQFLAVRPPAEARLLSVLVRGKPQQAISHDVGGSPAWLIPLPATSLVDLSFDVRVVLAGRLGRPLPKKFDPAGEEIELPAPQVLGVKDSPEFGLPVLQTLWRVDLPDDVDARVVESGGRTNLILREEAAAEEAYARRMLEDLKSQLTLDSKRVSGVQVKDHLHNLAITLQDVERVGQQQRQLVDEQAELIDKANRKLQELNQLRESVHEADQSVSLDRNDFGRQFILGNTVDILTRNAAEPARPEAEGAATFNFQRDLSGLKRADVKAAGKQVEDRFSNSRSMVRQQLSGQELQLNQSRSWADNANGAMGGGQLDILTLSPAATPESERQLFGDFVLPQSILGVGQAAGEAEAAAGRPASGAGEWTAEGGLSLPMTLPRSGQRLTFTKNSGDPRLTLSIRPRQTIDVAVGLGWAAVCLVIALCLWRGIASSQKGSMAARSVANILILIGLAGIVLAPGPARLIALAIFLAGAGWRIVTACSVTEPARRESPSRAS